MAARHFHDIFDSLTTGAFGSLPNYPYALPSRYDSLIAKPRLTRVVDPSEFQLLLNVSQFRAEEVNVKIDKEGFIVISAKHEEHPDEHGYVSRSFTRRCLLPADVDPDTLNSVVTKDGVLAIKGKRKVPPTTDKCRIVPIVREQPQMLEEYLKSCSQEAKPVQKV